MGIKYYKLNTQLYEPYWTIDNKIVPYDHIETMISTLEEYTGGTGWIECTNIEWKDINNIFCSGTIDSLPTYVKIDTGSAIYYYYLIDRTYVKSIKDNEVYYEGVYKLDDYMTIFHHKLEQIIESNPNVLTNRCFDNRWYTMTYGEEYTIDFVKQRYLSNTIPELNTMSVRTLAYSTTANDLWTLNFSDISTPESVTFNIWSGEGSMSIPFSTLATANSRGRYEYIICKPTAMMSSKNNTLRSCDTKQQFFVIPLISGYEEQILHALNDFDITGEHTHLLDPFGDNQIGLYECDIPFTMFVGWNLKGLYGVTPKYIAQPMSSSYDETVNIPFFVVNNNAPIVFKIIDYTKYTNGMYGKFLNFVNNISEWTPDTEPALWNPTYYKEVYNNGNSNLVSDASRFIFKWTKDALVPMGMQCYLCFSDNLNIAYNYGDLTNTSLPTLDNTESVDGNLSLSNLYFGSASAKYFTENATTTATNIQVRQSEQKQAWIDASLDSVKSYTKSVLTPGLSNGILPWTFAVNQARAKTDSWLSIAKTMVDTRMTQDRANKQFRSSINNLVSSPSPVLSNASTKAVIPNKNDLFATWGIELHPNDKKVVFTDYVHNGYPSNEVKSIQDVFNRQFMNILYIDTTYNDEDLRKILWEDTDKAFNTPYWNQMFLGWLNDTHKVYNTWWLINCTDYYSPNYISNIEKELPVIPTPKTYIGRYITVFRNIYKYSELLDNLKSDNPNTPEGFWDDVEIIEVAFNHFVIKAKSTSTKYFGTILQSAIVYKGYIQDGDYKHYFLNFDFLCNKKIWSSWTIVCPDGTQYKSSVFNLPIVVDDAIETIPNGFLSDCTTYNQDLSFLENATYIGSFVLNNCNIYNTQHGFTLDFSKLTHVGEAFMFNNRNFEGIITVKGDVTNMAESDYTLAIKDTTGLAYASGIQITGDSKVGFHLRFPNRTQHPYRKLLEV